MKRRQALGAVGALLACGAGLEYASLRGVWDHRWSSITLRSEFEKATLLLADKSAPANQGAIVHIGHSTHLLVVDGVRLLTDPWFYDPAFGAMRHAAAPAAPPAGIGPLHAILISHDHPDHCDERALREMAKPGIKCLVPTDDLAGKVKRCGFDEVYVLALGETISIEGTKISAVPAVHDVIEIGFVVTGSTTTIYFAGDTALHPDLEAIAERFAPKISILPVDGTRIRGDKLHVMRPQDAVIAARKLGSQLVLPSHAEATFHDPLARYVLTENVEQAGQVFAALMKTALPDRTVLLPSPGELMLV